MPEWGERPDLALDDSLHRVLDGLEDEIADNPTFQSVTGIPVDKMIKHATEAITIVFDKKMAGSMTIEDLVQCYSMGFVIGMRFASYQKEHAGGEQ